MTAFHNRPGMLDELSALIASGCTHAAIAAHYGISSKTVQRSLRSPELRAALAAQRRHNADRILRKVDAVLAARVDAHADEMSTAELLRIRRELSRYDVAPAAPAELDAADLELLVWSELDATPELLDLPAAVDTT